MVSSPQSVSGHQAVIERSFDKQPMKTIGTVSFIVARAGRANKKSAPILEGGIAVTIGLASECPEDRGCASVLFTLRVKKASRGA
jgi:hypothetical protein